MICRSASDWRMKPGQVVFAVEERGGYPNLIGNLELGKDIFFHWYLKMMRLHCYQESLHIPSLCKEKSCVAHLP